MTKREALDHVRMMDTLNRLGISYDDSQALRRISMTLRRWFEMECGTGDGQRSISIEREGENADGKPYQHIQYPTPHGYVDRRYPIADKETGARKRLAVIMSRYPGLTAYVQGDPRGCSLYILTTEQIGTYDIDSIYTRGVAIA